MSLTEAIIVLGSASAGAIAACELYRSTIERVFELVIAAIAAA